MNAPMRLALKLEPFSITLIIANAPKVDWTDYPRLDPSRADDHLIVSAFAEPLTSLPTLVTFDTGLLIRARSIQLPVIRSHESWALPPQQDELEKKIARLEQELLIAKSTDPSVSLRLNCPIHNGLVRLVVPKLEALSKKTQERLLEKVQQKFQIKKVGSSSRILDGFHLNVGGISEGSVLEYKAAYKRFLDEYAEQFASLHEVVGRALCFGEIIFAIENCSTITATNLQVSIHCPNNAFFVTRSDMEMFGGSLTWPRPPRPPRDLFEPIGSFDHLRNGFGGQQDKTEFNWLKRPVGGEEGAILACEEFRAKKEFVGSFYIYRSDSGANRFEIEISAKNLRNPAIISAEVEFISADGNWSDDSVLRRLPDWIATEVSKEA